MNIEKNLINAGVNKWQLAWGVFFDKSIERDEREGKSDGIVDLMACTCLELVKLKKKCIFARVIDSEKDEDHQAWLSREFAEIPESRICAGFALDKLGAKICPFIDESEEGFSRIKLYSFSDDIYYWYIVNKLNQFKKISEMPKIILLIYAISGADLNKSAEDLVKSSHFEYCDKYHSGLCHSGLWNIVKIYISINLDANINEYKLNDKNYKLNEKMKNRLRFLFQFIHFVFIKCKLYSIVKMYKDCSNCHENFQFIENIITKIMLPLSELQNDEQYNSLLNLLLEDKVLYKQLQANVRDKNQSLVVKKLDSHTIDEQHWLLLWLFSWIDFRKSWIDLNWIYEGWLKYYGDNGEDY